MPRFCIQTSNVYWVSLGLRLERDSGPSPPMPHRTSVRPHKLQVEQLTVVAGAPAGPGDAARLSWVLDRRAVMPELLPSARISFRRVVRACVATLPTVLYGNLCRLCVLYVHLDRMVQLQHLARRRIAEELR